MLNEIIVALKVNDSELDAAQTKADKLVATLERAKQLMQEIDAEQKKVASTEKAETVNEVVCDIFRLLIKEFEEQANNPHIHPPKMSVL